MKVPEKTLSICTYLSPTGHMVMISENDRNGTVFVTIRTNGLQHTTDDVKSVREYVLDLLLEGYQKHTFYEYPRTV